MVMREQKQLTTGTAMAEQNFPFPRDKKPPHTQGYSPPHSNSQKEKPIGGLIDLSSLHASGRPLALRCPRSERRYSGYWDPTESQGFINKFEARTLSNFRDVRWEY